MTITLRQRDDSIKIDVKKYVR